MSRARLVSMCPGICQGRVLNSGPVERRYDWCQVQPGRQAGLSAARGWRVPWGRRWWGHRRTVPHQKQAPPERSSSSLLPCTHRLWLHWWGLLRILARRCPWGGWRWAWNGPSCAVVVWRGTAELQAGGRPERRPLPTGTPHTTSLRSRWARCRCLGVCRFFSALNSTRVFAGRSRSHYICPACLTSTVDTAGVKDGEQTWHHERRWRIQWDAIWSQH